MPKNYRLLKGIVITLGILIIVMVIVLIVASVMKYKDQKRAEAALVERYQSSQVQKPNLAAPFEIDLNLETDQEVLSVDNGYNNLLVRIGRDRVTEKILLIDYNGKITGTINIK